MPRITFAVECPGSNPIETTIDWPVLPRKNDFVVPSDDFEDAGLRVESVTHYLKQERVEVWLEDTDEDLIDHLLDNGWKNQKK